MRLTLSRAVRPLVVGLILVCPSQAAAAQAAVESEKATRQAPRPNTDAVPDIPAIVEPAEPILARATGSTSHPKRPLPPDRRRAITIVPRHDKALEMSTYGSRPDGTQTFYCRGGIVITGKSLISGTIRIEAEAAEISAGPKLRDGDAREADDHESGVEDTNQPFKVRFIGNVIVDQVQAYRSGQRYKWAIRAPELEYEYVADRLVATDAKMEITASGTLVPMKVTSPRLEFFHPLEWRPDGSFGLSEVRELRLGPAQNAIHD
jgi:hypothetical protein